MKQQRRHTVYNYFGLISVLILIFLAFFDSDYSEAIAWMGVLIHREMNIFFPTPDKNEDKSS